MAPADGNVAADLTRRNTRPCSPTWRHTAVRQGIEGEAPDLEFASEFVFARSTANPASPCGCARQAAAPICPAVAPRDGASSLGFGTGRIWRALFRLET
jgi:hypothetical protein